MAISYLFDDRDLQVGLGSFRATLSDKTNLLHIAGNVMRTSIARTFREQGSPAGSWPALAASTLMKKGYGKGHRLLILSGRLFGSISYAIVDGVLTIGTNLVYAAVQQFGSKDRQGAAIGPQAKLADRAVSVGAHQRWQTRAFRQYGQRDIVDSRGRHRSVRVRAAGPANARRVNVSAHSRHQNIPPRPYLVFRPEDPGRIASAFEAYISGKAVSIGKVGA